MQTPRENKNSAAGSLSAPESWFLVLARSSRTPGAHMDKMTRTNREVGGDDHVRPTEHHRGLADEHHRGRHLGDGMARLILEQMTYKVIVRI